MKPAPARCASSAAAGAARACRCRNGPGLRPTADRVRETLFNWLQPVLPGARVLDLFAGTGALGLEAVSRGAAQAVLVERDARWPAACARPAGAAEGGERGAAWCTPMRWHGCARPAGRTRSTWPSSIRRSRRTCGAGARGAGAVAGGRGWLYVESPRPTRRRAAADWALHREGRTREVRYRPVPAAAVHLPHDSRTPTIAATA